MDMKRNPLKPTWTCVRAASNFSEVGVLQEKLSPFITQLNTHLTPGNAEPKEGPGERGAAARPTAAPCQRAMWKSKNKMAAPLAPPSTPHPVHFCPQIPWPIPTGNTLWGDSGKCCPAWPGGRSQNHTVGLNTGPLCRFVPRTHKCGTWASTVWLWWWHVVPTMNDRLF